VPKRGKGQLICCPFFFFPSIHPSAWLRYFLLGDDSPNLEAAAYAQLATLIANKVPFHECEGCETMFTPTHGRQRYCTPQCSKRTRKARQRAKEA